MNHAKTFTAITLAGLLAASLSATAANMNDFTKAEADAKAAIDAAAAANYEWRDSEKMLKEAGKAAKAGDFDKAVKLANKAKRQGDLAVAQAKAQKDVKGPH
ncbi:MAG: SoxXA-binding protein [Gammaproteobacteria bacterium]|nr:SoxXA-binding protein [Gammaproteobacteria bacterium]MDH5734882.1 SoxXA-binding protein [Gammaproteobacteria bacterium]